MLYILAFCHGFSTFIQHSLSGELSMAGMCILMRVLVLIEKIGFNTTQ